MGQLDSLFPMNNDRKFIEQGLNMGLMLFRHKGKLYCTDGFSSAFKYPMLDAKIAEQGQALTIEVHGRVLATSANPR